LLDNLKYLNLESNALNGTIPSEIGLLTNLEAFRLRRNGLGGTVPQEIYQLENLKFLDLDLLLFRDPEFSCDETYIEVIVTTGYYAEETWEIVDDDLTSVASGGNYTAGQAAHLEQICAPANACTFVLRRGFAEVKRLGKVYENNAYRSILEVDICS